MPTSEIDRLAGAQHGLITTAQLRDAGHSKDAIRHLVRRGSLVVARRGVYRAAGAARTERQSVLAAVLDAGSTAVASHETAAALWLMPHGGSRRLEVSIARATRRVVSQVLVHRFIGFHEEEHTVIDGIPVTTYARTIVDLSAGLSPIQLGVVLDHGRRTNRLTLPQLRASLDRVGPAPGRRPSVIRELLDARDPTKGIGDSDLEEHFVRVLVAGGLPEPVRQHPVVLAGRRYRLDLAYPEAGLAIEVDGFLFHTHRTDFDRDRRRANDLVVAGWTLLRFTSATGEAEAVAAVRAALAATRRRTG